MAVFSIAHLGDAERMFFVSLLLNQIVAWMRGQTGTTSLRAVIYMDEILGYFPPVANPSSKAPLMTLLKQGRAFGLGVVLATQNPVDLDYKGLANTGTWFLGRLQTERDKARMLDGLEGAAAGSMDRGETDRLLSALDKRVFLLHNVHDKAPVVFQTRWTLSYLRGPLSRDQIRALTPEAAVQPTDAASPSSVAPEKASAATGGRPTAGAQAQSSAPIVPPGIQQFFVPAASPSGPARVLAGRAWRRARLVRRHQGRHRRGPRRRLRRSVRPRRAGGRLDDRDRGERDDGQSPGRRTGGRHLRGGAGSGAASQELHRVEQGLREVALPIRKARADATARTEADLDSG